ERCLALLARGHDAGEEPLQLARNHDVADLDSEDLDPDLRERARRTLHDRGPDPGPGGEDLVHGPGGKGITKAQLQLDVERLEEALVVGHGCDWVADHVPRR